MRVDVVNIFPRCFIGLIKPVFRYRTPNLSGLLVSLVEQIDTGLGACTPAKACAGRGLAPCIPTPAMVCATDKRIVHRSDQAVGLFGQGVPIETESIPPGFDSVLETTTLWHQTRLPGAPGTTPADAQGPARTRAHT